MGVTIGHPFSENNSFRINYLFTFPVHLAFKLSLRDRVRNFSKQPDHFGLLRVWAQRQIEYTCCVHWQESPGKHQDPRHSVLSPLCTEHKALRQRSQGPPGLWSSDLPFQKMGFVCRHPDSSREQLFFLRLVGSQIPLFSQSLSVRLRLSSLLLKCQWIGLDVSAFPESLFSQGTKPLFDLHPTSEILSGKSEASSWWKFLGSWNP